MNNSLDIGFIYGIRVNHTVVYVGRSKNLLTRAKHHLNCVFNPYRWTNWVLYLTISKAIKKQIPIEFIILIKCSVNELSYYEANFSGQYGVNGISTNAGNLYNENIRKDLSKYYITNVNRKEYIESILQSLAVKISEL